MFFKKCFKKHKFTLSHKIQTVSKSEKFLPFSKKKELVKLSSDEIFVRIRNLFLFILTYQTYEKPENLMKIFQIEF